MDDGLTVEILGDEPSGPPPGRGSGPLGDRSRSRWYARLQGRLSDWLRSHRLVAALTGGAVLVGGGVVATRLMPEEPWPTIAMVTVVQTPDDPAEVGPWTAGADGRPTTPVALSLTPSVKRVLPAGARAAATASLQVVGLTGPGVIRNALPPTPVPDGDAPVTAASRTEIDCTKVPETVPDDAYGLGVEATFAGHRRHQVVTDRAGSQLWGQRVQFACGTWLARRSLVVTTMTAKVLPTRQPTLEISLTATNSGDRRLTLDRVPSDGEAAFVVAGSAAFAMAGPAAVVRGNLPLQIPAHGSATATVTAEVSNCDPPGSPRPTGEVVSTDLGLLGYAGPAPEAGTVTPSQQVGRALSGLTLSAAASTALTRGVAAACSGLSAPEITVPAVAVHRDATGTVLLDLDVAIPAGTSRRTVTVEASPYGPGYSQPDGAAVLFLRPERPARVTVPPGVTHTRVTLTVGYVRGDVPTCPPNVTGTADLRLTVLTRGTDGVERELYYTPTITVPHDALLALCRPGA